MGKPVELVVRSRRQAFTTISAALFMLVPVLFISFVSIECTRSKAGGECDVRERGVLTWRTTRIALADLVGFRVDESTDSDGDEVTRLVMVTTHGETPLNKGYDNIDETARREFVDRFAKFRSSDEQHYEARTGRGGLGFLVVWVAACTFFLYMNNRRAFRAVIDPARRVVRVRKMFGWRELPLTRDVAVVTSHGEWRLRSAHGEIRLPQEPRAEDVLAFHAAIRDATQ